MRITTSFYFFEAPPDINSLIKTFSALKFCKSKHLATASNYIRTLTTLNVIKHFIMIDGLIPCKYLHSNSTCMQIKLSEDFDISGISFYSFSLSVKFIGRSSSDHRH